MRATTLDSLIHALMYEGYLLYPYRPSTKNTKRGTFGVLFPPAYCDAQQGAERSSTTIEFIMKGDPNSIVTGTVHFLRVTNRTTEVIDDTGAFVAVEAPQTSSQEFQSWQECEAQTIALPGMAVHSFLNKACRQVLNSPGWQMTEPAAEQQSSATRVLRTRSPLVAEVTARAMGLDDQHFRISMTIANRTSIDEELAARMTRDAAAAHSMAAVHALVHVEGGEWISSIDPPAHLANAVQLCSRDGWWPVLVGNEGERQTMLASPIILYDYPRLAPESPGEFFDGTEIDEMLSLRIATLTDAEKRMMADLDERGRALLDRTQFLANEHWQALHGRTTIQKNHAEPAAVNTSGNSFGVTQLPSVGSKVRLRPSRQADAMDLVLNGRTATVVAVEQDYEDQHHIVVTVDDDPGADIGRDGKIAHRFYFHANEVEPFSANAGTSEGGAE